MADMKQKARSGCNTSGKVVQVNLIIQSGMSAFSLT